ncbi:2-C-methyl-D-erythritol 4-phosphate cytidylyltransferase [Clostridium formicaceticum]|nr:2-C-methyl-D-erythritol 4-phosphate cytidylyltransferase [Clostridium formicaceticum]
MGQGFNKQYILLKKKPIIAHTLTVFEESEYIDEILLVVGENEINFTTENIIKKYGFKKVIQVISGGKERQDSVYAGLLAIKDLCEIVLIHDGARPFLEKKLIQKTIDVAKNMGAAITGMPVKDTIKIINDKMEVVDTPDRSQLWGVQTPQAFQYRLLKSAYDNIMTEGVFVTDDAMALERYGHAVAVVQGSYENIKITTPEDLLVAESILRREK